MPKRAACTCSRSNCPGIVRNGECSECGPRRKANDREHDQRRGTAASRGYDARWRKTRLLFLRANPLCVMCAVAGLVVPATDVHHVIAKRDGGTDEESNLQALCKSHHSKLTNAGQ
jgi:5-methylcytosine-specific restriction protein A